jgi:hypothetical protein
MDTLIFINRKLNWYIEKSVTLETRQEIISKMVVLGFELIDHDNKKAA